MLVQTPYKLYPDKAFEEKSLSEGLFIAVTHASRIPPHIGMIAGGKYHSLTIKGQEINFPLEAFLKNIRIRKIPSLFIKINSSGFGSDFLLEHFVKNVQRFVKVTANGVTCLSPVRSFFEEVYSVPTQNTRYLFELLPELEKKSLIEHVSSLNITVEEFDLPVYDLETLYAEIEKANREAEQIRKSRIANQ